MSDTDKKIEAGLDAVFDAARIDTPVPSDALMARILADAKSAQGSHEPMPSAVPARRSVRSVLSEVFGGFAGVSTLAACVGLGVIIGVSAPDAIAPYWSAFNSGETEDAFGLYFDDEF